MKYETPSDCNRKWKMSGTYFFADFIFIANKTKQL